jgi:hypothetical protein
VAIISAIISLEQNLLGMSLSKKKMLSGAGMLAANARGG